MTAPTTPTTPVFHFRRAPLAAIVFGLLFLQGTAFAASLRFLPWDEEIAGRKLGLQNGKSITELQELHPGKRSKAINAATGEAPLLLVALDRKTPEGKAVTVEIKMAADLQSPLVLIIPDPKHPTGLRTFVIEDNTARFAWGTVRILNATGKQLIIRQEKTVTALPNSWTPVDLAAGGKARNVSVQLVARDKPKDILYSAVWEHHPDVRKLAFIVPGADARTGVVDFKIIPEDRRTLEPEPAPAAQP